MENEVTIKHNENEGTLTFQAKGEVYFLEHITRVVLSEFNNDYSESNQSFVKDYDSQKGYVGETIEMSKADSNVPEHYLTGVKISKNGNQRYKCRYICTHYGTKENKYIEIYCKYILCRVCNKKLHVDWVEDNHDAEHDNYNNFAYAGKFSPIFNE